MCVEHDAVWVARRNRHRAPLARHASARGDRKHARAELKRHRTNRVRSRTGGIFEHSPWVASARFRTARLPASTHCMRRWSPSSCARPEEEKSHCFARIRNFAASRGARRAHRRFRQRAIGAGLDPVLLRREFAALPESTAATTRSASLSSSRSKGLTAPAIIREFARRVEARSSRDSRMPRRNRAHHPLSARRASDRLTQRR